MGNDLFEAEQNVFCLNKKRKGKEKGERRNEIA